MFSIAGLPHNVVQKRSPSPNKNGGLQQPFFDTLVNPDTGQGGRNVTIAEGGKALLFCTVRNLNDNSTVSLQKNY